MFNYQNNFLLVSQKSLILADTSTIITPAFQVEDLAKTEAKKPCCATKKSCCPSDSEVVYQEKVRLPCSDACDLGEGALGKEVKSALAGVHPEILKK